MAAALAKKTWWGRHGYPQPQPGVGLQLLGDLVVGGGQPVLGGNRLVGPAVVNDGLNRGVEADHRMGIGPARLWLPEGPASVGEGVTI